MSLTSVPRTAPTRLATNDWTPPPPPATRPRGSFRRDIAGLRAVAVLAVVLSHADMPGFGGGYVGVDVFLVISGFLITDHLLRELDRTGQIRFLAFYARRIRRLLPAAVTVVLVAGSVTYLYGSSLAARNFAADALWTAANAMNIKLAVEGTDYFASENAPSALQHFWSLAVEEQFYLVWPLLVVLGSGMLLHRRGRGCSRRSVAVVVAVVLVVSLGLSVWQTGVAQSWAYFGLHTRAWELAAGALLAIALPAVRRLPAGTGAMLSWAGLAMIVASVTLFAETTPFPGYAAALPVGGAVLVMLGGTVAGPRGAEFVLGRGPMQSIGAVSYSWYLWHWPVLILMPAIMGWESTPVNNLFVVFVAFLLSVVAYFNIEGPARNAPWLASTRRGLVLGVALATTVAVVASAALVALPPTVGAGAPVNVRIGDLSAVRASLAGTAAPANLTPVVDQAPDDVPASRGNQCHLELLESEIKRPCDYGDVTADRTVVLFGDSHADAWLPAIEQIAAERQYRLLSRTKAACPAVDLDIRNDDLGRDYTECALWRGDVMDEIAEVRPDLVVLSSSYGVGGRSPADWVAATTYTVSKLVELGIAVVFIGDTPRRADQTGPDCVAAHLDDVSQCNTAQDLAQPHRLIASATGQAVARSGGIFIDPTSWFCADGQCPSVVGNYLVYRDQSHVTASYMKFLVPELKPLLPLSDRLDGVPS
jgi:peptidoglycan/LPS O-acetylase OafA/YrhL